MTRVQLQDVATLTVFCSLPSFRTSRSKIFINNAVIIRNLSKRFAYFEYITRKSNPDSDMAISIAILFLNIVILRVGATKKSEAFFDWKILGKVILERSYLLQKVTD